MERPTYKPFQGGIAKKMVKILCLLGFSYTVVQAIALERKDAITAAIGMVSFMVLGVMSWIERSKYWGDLKKWAATRNVD